MIKLGNKLLFMGWTFPTSGMDSTLKDYGVSLELKFLNGNKGLLTLRYKDSSLSMAVTIVDEKVKVNSFFSLNLETGFMYYYPVVDKLRADLDDVKKFLKYIETVEAVTIKESAQAFMNHKTGKGCILPGILSGWRDSENQVFWYKEGVFIPKEYLETEKVAGLGEIPVLKCFLGIKRDKRRKVRLTFTKFNTYYELSKFLL